LITLQPVSTSWVSPTERPELLEQVKLSATPTPGQCQVLATALNVRSGPGIDYPAVAWLSAGQEVKPLGDLSAGWLQVETVWKKSGWINTKYIACEGQP
jgi:uncharacterized protein YgiM (DUF1202 family)